MYRTLKLISPLILVIFFFTAAVGPGWGEEIKSEMYLFTYDKYSGPRYESWISNPEVGKVFKMTIRIYYDNEQIKDLKIVQPDDFEVIKEYVDYGINPLVWQNVFILKAPSSTGEYAVNFKGTNKDGAGFDYNKQIKVTEKESNFLSDAISLLPIFVWTGLTIAILGSVLLKKSWY